MLALLAVGQCMEATNRHARGFLHGEAHLETRSLHPDAGVELASVSQALHRVADSLPRRPEWGIAPSPCPEGYEALHAWCWRRVPPKADGQCVKTDVEYRGGCWIPLPPPDPRSNQQVVDPEAAPAPRGETKPTAPAPRRAIMEGGL